MGGPGFNINTDVVTAAKVGVGTDSPGERVEITGAGWQVIKINTATPGAGMQVTFYEGATQRATFHYHTGLDRVIIGSTQAEPLVFYTDYAERMRIDAEGKVGIGTETPGERLEVNGKVKASDNVVLDNGGNDSPGVVARSKNTTGQTIDGVANGQYFPDWYMDHYTSQADPSIYSRLRFIRGATEVMTIDPQGTLRLIGKVNVSGRDAVDAQGYCLYG